MKKNIILTGFMGTGKTTVGRMLAVQLGYEFVDTDELIQSRLGKSIPEIFSQMGEAAFRQIESDIAKELANQEGLVISTGGRMMLDPENVTALSQGSRVFCLVATPEEILKRLQKDKDHPRPLLRGPNPEERVVELIQQRQRGYQRFLQVTTNNQLPAEVAADLLNLIQQEPKRIPIKHPAHSYDYIVGSGLLPSIRQLANVANMLVVITDSNVGELYAPSCGTADHVITVPVGKQYKTLQTVEKIYHQLLDIGFDRSGTIVALGGSVIGDIAGFAAATFMRGTNFVQCPTTLRAMVDSSVGGKVGLDLPQGKNLVGAFKQPSAVIADLVTLQTLSPEAFSSGMAEVTKHGLLADTHLLEKVESGSWAACPSKIDHTVHPKLQALIAQAVQGKISIVQDDPYDQGRR
jgi:shikimate kinase / 3-dehydroquinate synthase